ncbi:hypothetical protein KKC83_01480 [Patescibacteria group bacterium]|nr:hypothetical protein [Candidatus Falkowbacteria bacterium]MBU3906052.1 hypothetical protein [Patescibacteria group bacterium]MBU4015081.1 hypothetical protein [Patescibacteria group bacterium]MBU4026197.1 hypothetical protein [Patescibacteria group bacterium]MBU4073701.1 hypothetical protein [Patescibacteria group bacterium]
MSEKDLLLQLNKLKDIKPSFDWKNSNREILFNQITRGHAEEEISKFDIFKNMLPHNMFSRALQPVLAVVLIVLIVASGGVISLNAARDTNPGDSLYIAKIISEKAQIAITFNDKGKAKLGVEFASNRALEITRVIAESEKNKEKQVEKLTKDFKKEISAVKARLVKIDSAKDNSAKENKEAAETQDDDLQVFSANLEKSDQGMEIYDSAGNLLSAEEESAAVEDLVVAGPSNLDDILTEAEKLFDEQDYSGTLNKLSEANDMMDQEDVSDETAGADTASTTIDSVDAGEDESPADTASSTEE